MAATDHDQSTAGGGYSPGADDPSPTALHPSDGTSRSMAGLRELTTLLLSTESIEDYLSQVVRLAASTVLDGSSCGLTLRRDGQTLTVSSSDSLASRVDEIQYGSGEGPCLHALETGSLVLIEDLGSEERFGSFRLHALAAGVRSSLSVPVLSGEQGAAGALNLYSTHPYAFQQAEIATAGHFADQAAGALALAVRLAQQAELTAQLEEALGSRAVIDQAVGIIMGQNRCSAETAFGLLRQASQHRNTKLRDVAADIVRAVAGVVAGDGVPDPGPATRTREP